MCQGPGFAGRRPVRAQGQGQRGGGGRRRPSDVPPAPQGPGEPRDVFLKVASGRSPEIKDFFVLIYA